MGSLSVSVMELNIILSKDLKRAVRQSVLPINMGSAQLATEAGLMGPNYLISTAVQLQNTAFMLLQITLGELTVVEMRLIRVRTNQDSFFVLSRGEALGSTFNRVLIQSLIQRHGWYVVKILLETKIFLEVVCILFTPSYFALKLCDILRSESIYISHNERLIQ